MKYVKPELEVIKYVIEDVMCASGVGDIPSTGRPPTQNDTGWAPVNGGSAK